jgi:hypothetical protein
MPQAGELLQGVEVAALVHPNSDDPRHATRAEHLPGLEWIMRPPLPKEGLKFTSLRHADARAQGDSFDIGPRVPQRGFFAMSAGRFGRWRRPIHASAAMWLATFSTGSLRVSVHHWPTKVTIPTSACA